MHILVVGLNHRSTPIDLRERLAFRSEQLPDTFVRLQEAGLQEVVVLSTCNRTEIYVGVTELNGTVGHLERFLSEHARLPGDALVGRLYSLVEPASVRHLFEVASGLDSMVLGESEILHQVKRAYELARDRGATGKAFNVLFQRALNAAKEVRTATGIDRGCLSIGSVAVELAERIVGRLESATVLLIGAGKLGELTIKRLVDRGVRDLRILNRSPERAHRLAARYGARAIPLGELSTQLCDADIVISSTSAPGFLLDRVTLEPVMRMRRAQPLCLIDLGVPRNVEPSTDTLEHVLRFDVDDLQSLLEDVQRERGKALEASRSIIDRKVERYLAWWWREGIACVPASSGLAVAH